MFCKATLFTAALALVASATPVSTHKKGISIPFQKRSGLTNADGTFNIDRAIMENVRTIKCVPHVPCTIPCSSDTVPSLLYFSASTDRT